MKRSTLIAVCSFVMVGTMASTTQACCYIPWLDPLAWLGFYGCGGYGPACCYGGYGGCCPRGYAPPMYGAYAPPAYAPPAYAPITGYTYPAAPVAPVAPQAACNCNGTVHQTQAMTAVRVPVTTYRAVTQYVPQTTYQTQYRAAQPAVAYGAPIYGTQAYSSPVYSAGTYPAPTYNAAAVPAPLPSTTYYGSGSIQTSPMIQSSPEIASPYPTNDIGGDHEYPSQSMLVPAIPNTHVGTTVPVRRVSYGVTPRSAASYPSALR
ncbi:MAG: hypothetical protein RIK87_19035 [Fuerstiella sp.]